MKSGKILLVSNISMPRASVELSHYASDVYAWNETEDEPYCKEDQPVPTRDIRWGRAALEGAFAPWQLIPEGFGAVLEVKTGAEWLIVARPPSVNDDEYEPVTGYFSRLSIFLADFQSRSSNKWHVEAILLTVGSRV
jgi:hypothetical protein